MRRILAISTICNQPHNLHGKYVPGSGVGASSVATRRLKLHKAAPCYTNTPQIQYLRVSDIATYDTNTHIWTSNVPTITQYQYLYIDITEDLHIPKTMIFTNNGTIENHGSFHTEYYAGVGAKVYNTGSFLNYGSIEVNNYCGFYTYGGGSVFNDPVVHSPPPNANIAVIPSPGGGVPAGIFALAPISSSTCGSATFTGNTTVANGSVTYTCPP